MLPLHLYELLIHCWAVGTVPQDMQDANIVTLYKNKESTVTVTAIVAFHYKALLERLSLGQCSEDFRSLPAVFTLSHNAASEPVGPP